MSNGRGTNVGPFTNMQYIYDFWNAVDMNQRVDRYFGLGDRASLRAGPSRGLDWLARG